MRSKTLADIDSGAQVSAYSPLSGVLHVDPRVARNVTQIFAIWAWIDTGLTNAVAGLLRADFVVVSDMLASLRSARMSALRAAVKSALQPEQRAAVNRAIDLLERARRYTRDLYAHHIWVYSEKAPADSLLLLDPRRVVRVNAELHAVTSFVDRLSTGNRNFDEISLEHMPAIPSSLDPRDVLILSSSDVVRDVQLSVSCVVMVDRLPGALSAESAVQLAGQKSLAESLRPVRDRVAELAKERSL